MALASTDYLYIQQGSDGKKTTLAALQAYLESQLGTVDLNAADTTALVALTGVSVGDFVFVADASGDGNVTSGWAIYRADVANPSTIAAGTGYRLLAKEETLGISLAVNLGYTASATQGVVTNDSGNNSTLPAADGTNAGLMVPAQFDKLGFITVTQAVDLDNIEQDLADVITVSGVAANATNLGTFTGSTITDNVTVKAALQEVETALEAISGSTNLAYTAAATQGTVTSDTGTNATLPAADGTNAGLMVPAQFNKLGFITVTQAVDLDNIEADLADAITASGIAANATNFGTFTGSTITDNVTAKVALQELETALEAATHNAVSELAGDNPIVVGGTGQELSFDISSLPDA